MSLAMASPPPVENTYVTSYAWVKEMMAMRE
jgi:hypothetical protein